MDYSHKGDSNVKPFACLCYSLEQTVDQTLRLTVIKTPQNSCNINVMDHYWLVLALSVCPMGLALLIYMYHINGGTVLHLTNLHGCNYLNMLNPDAGLANLC